jgi:aminoglycoside 6-adenylyltransferase
MGAGPTQSPPSSEEFLQVVNDFLYHIVWTAKHVRRGELFWAKRGLDCHLVPLLLQMLEWHTKAIHGQQYDTWFRGRFLEKWADPRATAGLRNASARYDETEMGNGLSSLLALFQWVSIETSEKLNLPYPRSSSLRIAEWLDDCLTDGT